MNPSSTVNWFLLWLRTRIVFDWRLRICTGDCLHMQLLPFGVNFYRSQVASSRSTLCILQQMSMVITARILLNVQLSYVVACYSLLFWWRCADALYIPENSLQVYCTSSLASVVSWSRPFIQSTWTSLSLLERSIDPVSVSKDDFMYIRRNSKLRNLRLYDRIYLSSSHSY